MTHTIPPDIWAWFPERAVAAGDEVPCATVDEGCLYVLISGRVRLEVRERTLTTIDVQGAVLGAIGPLRDPSLRARMVAETDVVLREVDDFLELCDARPDVAVTVARTLAQRLDELHGLVVARIESVP